MYSLRGSWVFTEVKSKLTYIVIIINIIIVHAVYMTSFVT